MTSQLIGLSLSDHLFSPIKAEVECCKACNNFGYWVTDCSTTKILSWSITSQYQCPTGDLTTKRGSYPAAEVQSVYSSAPSWQGGDQNKCRFQNKGCISSIQLSYISIHRPTCGCSDTKYHPSEGRIVNITLSGIKSRL